MGVKAMSWAFEQPLAGNEKVVLLALADHARDDGMCWPGHELIAAKAYVSTKTVTRILKKLEDRGFIRREQRRKGDGTRASDLIRLPVQGDHVSADPSPPTSSDTSVRGTVREPSSESLLPGAAGASNGAKPVTYRSRRVPAVIVEMATHVLGVFNEVTGRRTGARTGAGDASPALKQIIGAMLARPEVEPEKWEAAVRNTAANPPGWLDGQMQIGHVFGERAAEWALANRGRVTEKNEDPGYQQRVDDFKDALASFQSGE